MKKSGFEGVDRHRIPIHFLETQGLTPASQNTRCRSGRRGGGSGFGLFPVAAFGLDDQAHLDRLGTDLDPDDGAVDQGADLLNVRLELPGGDAGDLRADATEVLGFATMGNLIAKGGLLTGKKANARHYKSSFGLRSFEPGILENCSGNTRG